MLPSVLELDPRPGDEVTHRAGDENLPGLGSRSNSSSDMDCDTAHVGPTKLNLTAVQTGADIDTQWTQRVPDRLRAPDGSPRPIMSRISRASLSTAARFCGA